MSLEDQLSQLEGQMLGNQVRRVCSYLPNADKKIELLSVYRVFREQYNVLLERRTVEDLNGVVLVAGYEKGASQPCAKLLPSIRRAEEMKIEKRYNSPVIVCQFRPGYDGAQLRNASRGTIVNLPKDVVVEEQADSSSDTVLLLRPCITNV